MTNTTDTQTNDLIEQVADAILDTLYDPNDRREAMDQARAAVLAVRRHDARGYGDRDEVLQAAVREYQSLVKSDLRTEALVSYVIRVATVERLRQAEEASR